MLHCRPSKPVLIVEDNDDLRTALVALLESEGYLTAEAANGAIALALLTDATVDPCLILLDLHMPVMGGAEFRTAQRLNPKLAGLTVVIYSGVADVARQALALDVVHYFQKPLNLTSLVSLVHQYCGAAAENPQAA